MIIRSGEQHDGKQGVSLAAGISGRSAGAKALCLHLVIIPPGTRGMPHYHAEHESAIYTVSGETEVWHGNGLLQRTIVRAGDFMYVPPGTPHLPVNRGDVMSVSVVARTDPQEQESVVIVELPRHLAHLLSLPVAIQE
ncbi:MAG TPA: cupin domain-containing protein [Trebonia sp.]|nr:cupin domain-containing protein [Trebonia sp.]